MKITVEKTFSGTINLIVEIENSTNIIPATGNDMDINDELIKELANSLSVLLSERLNPIKGDYLQNLKENIEYFLQQQANLNIRFTPLEATTTEDIEKYNKKVRAEKEKRKQSKNTTQAIALTSRLKEKTISLERNWSDSTATEINNIIQSLAFCLNECVRDSDERHNNGQHFNSISEKNNAYMEYLANLLKTERDKAILTPKEIKGCRRRRSNHRKSKK